MQDIKTNIMVPTYHTADYLNRNLDISYLARNFYCYHASSIVEMNDYIETNREFPEKIERMRGLLNG